MCRDAHAKRRYVDAFHSSLNNREQEFQEQMVVRFIKVQFISNFLSSSGYFALSISLFVVPVFLCTVLLFMAFAVFFSPSFSAWLFSSGLRSFLVEETPSAAQMIIAELQFHSSDSLRWGTVDFLCIMELQREWEKERSEEKGSAVSQSRPFHGVLSVRVCEYASLFEIRWHTGYFFERKLSKENVIAWSLLFHTLGDKVWPCLFSLDFPSLIVHESLDEQNFLHLWNVFSFWLTSSSLDHEQSVPDG